MLFEYELCRFGGAFSEASKSSRGSADLGDQEKSEVSVGQEFSKIIFAILFHCQLTTIKIHLLCLPLVSNSLYSFVAVEHPNRALRLASKLSEFRQCTF